MKLTKLKEKVDKAIEKYGDIDVYILLRRTEDCSECGKPKDRNCMAEETVAGVVGNGNGFDFWIEGEVV